LKRLRTRLLFLVLLAVLPALGAIVYSGVRAQHKAYARARNEAQMIDTLVAGAFRRNAQTARNLVTTLAQVPAVLTGSRRECDGFLRRVMRQNPEMGNIGVIDRSGYLACSAVPHAGRLYLGDRPYYRNALKDGQSVVGIFQIGRVVHVPLIVFAAPLRSGTSGGRAVVYASLKLEWLNKVAAASKLPAGSTLTVLDSRQHVIARYPRPGQWLGKSAGGLSELTRGLASHQFALKSRAGLNGVRQLFSTYAEGGTPGKPDYYVIVGIPQARVAESGRDAMLMSLVTLAVVTVLFLVLGWWGSKKLILSRVETLVSAAEQLGKGQRKARTRLEGRDELARLGTAFDAMADSLEEHNRQLEREVERANRLNRGYQVLSATNGAILRIRERDALLQEVCRIAVETGGYHMAWVGLVLPGNNRVQLAAHAGRNREIIEGLHVSIDASRPEGRGTVGPALRNLKPVAVNDIAGDARMAAWRDSLLGIGCLSVATFPLHIKGRVTGNLTLYSGQRDYFDEETVRILEEVAVDTTLGLELIETSEQRDYLIQHDPVTGLDNRQHFVKGIERMLRVLPGDRPPLSILAVEVTELSRISDHFGLYVADEIRLRLIPKLREILGDSDSLAALGADIFGLALLEDESMERAELVVEQLLGLSPFEIEVDGQQHLLTARIGKAPAEPGIAAEALVRNAEVALHSLEATSNKTYQVYARQQDDIESRRYRIRQGLRRAIANNELDVLYQPYQDVRTGGYVGAEALLRWNSADLGPVSPGEFVPIAEEEGLIGEIDAWVFRTVLEKVCQWRDEEIELGVISVNMSAKNFQDIDIENVVRSGLESKGIRPGYCPMALEITETAVVQDFEHVSEILVKLRAMGMRTYLDDYGTGYSSLLYLQRAPLDALKIDLSFIRRIAEDATSLALTRGSISLAHSLDLRVIAEGVETKEQLEILRDLDCDYAQGYLYSRPLPPDEFTKFIWDNLDSFIEKAPGPRARKGRKTGKKS